MCIHLRHKMELAPWGFNAEFVPLKWFILLRRKNYFSCKSGFYINYNEILEMTSFFFKRISEYIGYSCRLIIESLKGRKFESQHVKLGGWLFTFICWYLNFIVQCDQIGRFLHFGQLFKACGNNYIAQIFDILRQVSKSFIFLLDLFLGNTIRSDVTWFAYSSSIGYRSRHSSYSSSRHLPMTSPPSLSSSRRSSVTSLHDYDMTKPYINTDPYSESKCVP